MIKNDLKNGHKFLRLLFWEDRGLNTLTKIVKKFQEDKNYTASIMTNSKYSDIVK